MWEDDERKRKETRSGVVERNKFCTDRPTGGREKNCGLVRKGTVFDSESSRKRAKMERELGPLQLVEASGLKHGFFLGPPGPLPRQPRWQPQSSGAKTCMSQCERLIFLPVATKARPPHALYQFDAGSPRDLLGSRDPLSPFAPDLTERDCPIFF